MVEDHVCELVEHDVLAVQAGGGLVNEDVVGLICCDPGPARASLSRQGHDRDRQRSAAAER